MYHVTETLLYIYIYIFSIRTSCLSKAETLRKQDIKLRNDISESKANVLLEDFDIIKNEMTNYSPQIIENLSFSQCDSVHRERKRKKKPKTLLCLWTQIFISVSESSPCRVR